LGAGFQSELTGRENIFINGVISGLRRREVKANFDSIVDFAELDEFIDSPLHTYSSGMRMRLGFAIAVHIQPEILLIDEVLSVGDMAFQQKCLDRITQFKHQGCTILLVSHQTSFVKNHCDSVLWLHGGQSRAFGFAPDVVSRYEQAMNERITQVSGQTLVKPATPSKTFAHVDTTKTVSSPATASDPVDIKPDATITDLIRAGKTQLESGDVAAATTAWKQALALKPDDSGLCQELGHLLRRADQNETALAAFEHALTLTPNDHIIYIRLANLSNVLLQHQAALTYCDQGLSISPHNWSFYYLRGQTYGLLGAVETATAWYRRALDLAPDNLDIYLAWAETLKHNNQLEAGRQVYEQALALAPDKLEIHQALVTIYEAQKKYEAATGHYQRILELDPARNEALFGLAMNFIHQAHYHEAIELYQQINQIRPGLPEVHRALGHCYHKTGQTEQAINHYQQALTLNPDQPVIQAAMLKLQKETIQR
jgi:tetratricopeptide (TPR) repeat protein